MADKKEGYLEIGTSGKGEVVINLPMPHEKTGHMFFSANQARDLADSLIRKAMEADKERKRKRSGDDL